MIDKTHTLNKKQLTFFSENGYLIIRHFFNATDILKITSWTKEVSQWPETPGKHKMYFEQSTIDSNQRILNRIENIEPWHSGFSELFHGKLQKSCSQLFGEEAVLFKDKINFKLPGGNGFKAHQDVQAGWDRYGRRHITALVSIDACTIENGCLEIAPAKHMQGLLGASWIPLQENSFHYEPIPTNPGDVIFFDSYTPHRSQPNETTRPRRVLYVTWNAICDGDQRSRYYAEKNLNYPQDCERDPAKEYHYRV